MFINYVVEPYLTGTPLLGSSRYYSHFIMTWQNPHPFSCQENPIEVPPINTATGLHILKSQPELYNIQI